MTVWRAYVAGPPEEGREPHLGDESTDKLLTGVWMSSAGTPSATCSDALVLLATPGGYGQNVPKLLVRILGQKRCLDDNDFVRCSSLLLSQGA